MNFLFWLVWIIALILLFKSQKSCNNPNTGMKSNEKITILMVTLAGLIPILIISFGMYMAYWVNKTDYWYSKTAKQVSFHLYKPVVIPGGRRIVTKYETGKTIDSKTNAVQVVLDLSTDELLNGQKSSMIIVKQAGVEEGFNLSSFVTSLNKSDTMIAEELDPPVLSNQKAVFLHDPSENDQNFNPAFLYFTTIDGVLISISGNNATKDELLAVANGLQ